MNSAHDFSHSLQHIAIIMDGNNRWAKQKKQLGIAGHKAGVERLRDVLAACREYGINTLTVFAFSSENWQRPAKEVDALMTLFHLYLTNESKKLKKEGVRLRVIGNRDRFSKKLLKAIESAEAIASEGERTLVIAADYGGQWDIAHAAKKLAAQALEGRIQLSDITEQSLSGALSTADLPPLDLLIRTGGEQRISNFLLWQAAYAELYFSDDLWPDFGRESLHKAIVDFTQRQRRFGLTGDQVNEQSTS